MNNFSLLKDYLLSAAHHTISRVASRLLNTTYRKLSKIFILLDDDESINLLETYMTKDSQPEYFLSFLEEKARANKNLSGAEKQFISLMGVHKYEQASINKFLSIIGKDKSYLIRKLIESKSHDHLKWYISQLIVYDAKALNQHIVPTLINHYDSSLWTYIEIVQIIACSTGEALHTLLHNDKTDIQNTFEQYILQDCANNIDLIKNYSEYLYQLDSATFSKFEKEFLLHAESKFILEYSLRVTFSNKRLVLRRLVELKNENNLVEFIRHFPNYSHLLPML